MVRTNRTRRRRTQEQTPGSVEQIAACGLVKLYAERRSDRSDSLYLTIDDPTPDGSCKYRCESLTLSLTGARLRVGEVRAEAIARMQAVDKRKRRRAMSVGEDFDPEARRADFLEYFDTLARDRGGEGHSWRSVSGHLRVYSGQDAVAFYEITPRWLHGFRDYLLARLSPSMARLYLGICNRALRRAVREGILEKNPMDRVDSIRAHRTFLAPEEIAAFEQAPCPREDVRRAFLFACDTGIRISDQLAVRWSNIHGDVLDFVTVKTGKQARIPLNAKACVILATFPTGECPTGERPTDYVFPLPSKTTVSVTFERRRQAAGLRAPPTMHLARHTFATLLFNAGADSKTVAELLGDNLANAEIYARLLERTKRDAVDRLANIFMEEK